MKKMKNKILHEIRWWMKTRIHPLQSMKNFTYCLANKIAGGHWYPDYSDVIHIGPELFERPGIGHSTYDGVKKTIEKDKILQSAQWVGPIPFLVRDCDERGHRWMLRNGWPFCIWLDEMESEMKDVPFTRITIYFFRWVILDRYLCLWP